MADWSIQIPLSELAALQALPARMAEYEERNAQLRREVEAMRRMLYETIEVIGDLRRELRKR